MTSLQVMRWNQNVWYVICQYGMVWYVSTQYDVSIIGYCRVCTMMLVLQGMVWYASMVWYDVSML